MSQLFYHHTNRIIYFIINSENNLITHAIFIFNDVVGSNERILRSYSLKAQSRLLLKCNKLAPMFPLSINCIIYEIFITYLLFLLEDDRFRNDLSRYFQFLPGKVFCIPNRNRTMIDLSCTNLQWFQWLFE